LSRDPIGEVSGFNLLCMVENDLVNRLDPYGLADWTGSLANWSNKNIPIAQDRIANELGYFSIPINNFLSFANIAAHVPTTIDNLGTAYGTTGWYIDEPVLQPLVKLGEGAGTWWGNKTWENAAGFAADISTFASVMAAGLKPLPGANQPLLRKRSCPTEIVEHGHGIASIVVDENGVAHVTIGLVDKQSILSLAQSLKLKAQTAGATSVVVDTGYVLNQDLAIQLGLRSQSGKGFLGGKVTIVEGGLTPRFTITIPLKPK